MTEAPAIDHGYCQVLPPLKAGRAALLLDYVECCRLRPFAWGRHDCALFAAGAVLTLTGHDPAADARGAYTTEWGALRWLKRQGMTLRELAAQRLGEPRPVLLARRGDLVWLPDPGALGVCLGHDCAFPGPAGLEFRPLADCACCWRIG